MCRNNVKGAKTRDRLKAQTTIFGGFDYEGVRIDYGKNGGLQSEFSNTLAVGEDKSVLYPVGFPLRNFRFVSGGNYYSQDYLTHYFGEDGKSRICEKIKCDGDKQSPGDVRISRGPNETGHQKNEIDFEPFKYNYALPPLVVSTIDGVMEIDETRIDERPFKDRFGNWRCKNYNEIGAHVWTTNGDLVNYLHLDPKSSNLKLWQNAKQKGNSMNVKRGDIIGYLGNTGCSTGPHLHYDIKDYDLVTFYSTFQNISGLNILPEEINKTAEIQNYLELFFNIGNNEVNINYNL